jgi:hypothetical protein
MLNGDLDQVRAVVQKSADSLAGVLERSNG